MWLVYIHDSLAVGTSGAPSHSRYSVAIGVVLVQVIDYCLQLDLAKLLSFVTATAADGYAGNRRLRFLLFLML